MKTRMSLVSNSSSSSFICARPILEVASDMWKAITSDDWDEDRTQSDIRYKSLLPLIEKICKNPDVQSGKYGISMPSCNYDTEILVVGGKCHINTCNNHDWSDVIGLEYIPEEWEEETDKDRPKIKIPSGTFFYTIANDGKLLRPSNKVMKGDKKLICKKCQDRWGMQNMDAWDHNGYNYEDPDGNYYCPEHFEKLVVMPK